MKILFFLISVFLLHDHLLSSTGVNLFSPSVSGPGWAYYGHLNEHKRVVKLNPELRAVTVRNASQSMKICGFYIHHEADVDNPFVLVVIDSKMGFGEVRLKSGIKFTDLLDRYALQVEAYDCDQPPHFSERRYMLIEVGTVNRPRFDKNFYEFSVNSSTPEGSKIGEVVAIERPTNGNGNNKYQGICRYDIVSPSSVPFTINQYGSLFIKKILINPGISIKYKFYVRAADCNIQQRRMADVPVDVNIYNSCESYWEGLPGILKYKRGSGVSSLLNGLSKNPVLHLCEQTCAKFQIVMTARLNGNNLKLAVPENCKHDLEALKKHERLCDISGEAIDLLKSAPLGMVDRSVGGFYFSGDNIPVETHLDNTNHVLNKTFTLMFWMKHDRMNLNDPKQHILCNSDKELKNRHHYSVFLHNCKLLLLIRKEHWEGDHDRYQLSEWRYGPLKEVCDNKWHHYAIILNHGNPILQLDGEMSSITPDLLIEKPLQKLPGNLQGTKLTVGGCFHSKSNSYVQNFVGHLAGMRLLKNRAEAVNNIRCLATCGEAILLPHILDVISKYSSVTLFSENATLRSDNVNNLMEMLYKLSYVNTNFDEEFKTRKIFIDTEIKCGFSSLHIPRHTVNIDVLKHSSGESESDSKLSVYIYSDSKVQGYMKRPIELFPNLRFIKQNELTNRFESCIIRPIGPAIQNWESLNWPITMAINNHFTSLNNTHGLMLEAKQSFDVYEMIIRKITYVVHKVDPKYSNRKFGLMCNIDERTVTNDLIVEVNVKEDDLSTYYIEDDPVQSNNNYVLHAGGKKQGFEDKLLMKQKKQKGSPSVSNLSWIITIVVIVVFSLFVSMATVFVIQRRRRMKNNRFVQTANCKVIRLKELRKSEDVMCQPMETNSDIDATSIVSDCPDSCDEIDPEDNEHLNEDCDDENSCNRIRMSLPRSLWKGYGKPVDV